MRRLIDGLIHDRLARIRIDADATQPLSLTSIRRWILALPPVWATLAARRVLELQRTALVFHWLQHGLTPDPSQLRATLRAMLRPPTRAHRLLGPLASPIVLGLFGTSVLAGGAWWSWHAALHAAERDAIVHDLPAWCDLQHAILRIEQVQKGSGPLDEGSPEPPLEQQRVAIGEALGDLDQRIREGLPDDAALGTTLSDAMAAVVRQDTQRVVSDFMQLNLRLQELDRNWFIDPVPVTTPCSSLLPMSLRETLSSSDGAPDHSETCVTTMVNTYRRVNVWQVDHGGELLEVRSLRRLSRRGIAENALGVTSRIGGHSQVFLDRIDQFSMDLAFAATSRRGLEAFLPIGGAQSRDIRWRLGSSIDRNLQDILGAVEYARLARTASALGAAQDGYLQRARIRQTMLVVDEGGIARPSSGTSWVLDAVANEDEPTNEQLDLLRQVVGPIAGAVERSVVLHEVIHQLQHNRTQEADTTRFASWMQTPSAEAWTGLPHQTDGLVPSLQTRIVRETEAWLGTLARGDGLRRIILSHLFTFSANPMAEGQAEWYASRIILSRMVANDRLAAAGIGHIPNDPDTAFVLLTTLTGDPAAAITPQCARGGAVGSCREALLGALAEQAFIDLFDEGPPDLQIVDDR